MTTWLSLIPILVAGASAVEIVRARSIRRGIVALSLNSLSTAIVALILSAPLVAIIWALVGLCMVLCSHLVLAPASPHAEGETDAPKTRSPGELVWIIGLLFVLVLGGVLLFGRTPGQAVVDRMHSWPIALPQTLMVLLYHQLPGGIVGMALLSLVGVIAIRVWLGRR